MLSNLGHRFRFTTARDLLAHELA
ncbi:MAG: hypothetical protein ACLT2I_02490 [Corynebacterium variabile]